MSREVDERVVEMRFDNAQFEKNTRESMKTLDRLQEKLRFKDVDKGFADIEKAQKNVDFDEMEGALDNLKVKFSALDVMAVAALTNITNKIVDTGEKLVKSLSVDQVMSGWNKYTEKTSNVQTIMNATGKSIDEVNGYLNKLMWYSDETSYSFSEMTSAISQATAAGGDIKKMVSMVMGIANATADAGKTGLAFQSTIRNIIQSYSAGYLQLQDWKSLNLMGTATKALKQELIETAEELGTIKKGDVTIASFESTLSKKWATTKVMEKTFEKYASMMEAAYEMVQQNPGMTSSEALEKLSGQYGELAERAALAAQQATSFSQAIDSTKDAVSSKWMKAFELIFGNKDEATETWTELANRLYDIFVPPIDALNEKLSEGLDTGWQKLNNKLGDQANVYDTVLEKVALASGAVTEESIQEAGSFAKALRKGGVNAALLQNGLETTLVTLKNYLALSDKELDARNLDKEAIERDYEALSKLNEEFRNGTASLTDYAESMSELSGREHLMQSLWNIMDALSALVQPIHEAFQEIFPPTSGKQIKSFAEGLDYATGKLIISGETAEKIKGAFTGLFRVVKVGTDAISKVVKTAGKVLGGLNTALKPVKESLLDVAGGLGDFAAEVGEALTGTKTLSERFEAIRGSLKKLLSPLGDLKSLVKNFSLSGLKDQLDALVKSGGDLDWVNRLSENAQKVLKPLIVVAGQTANGGLTLLGVVGAVAGGVIANLGEAADFVKKWVKGQLEGADSLETTLTSLPVKIGEAVTSFAETFQKSVSRIEATADTVADPVRKFFEALKEGFDSISGTDVYRLLSLIDVGLLAFTIGQFAKATKSFSSIVSNLFEGPVAQTFKAMTGSFNALSGALKSWTKTNNTKVLTSIAGAVVMLAGAMWVMAQIDPKRLGAVLVSTLALIGAVAMAAKSLQPSVKAFGTAMDAMKSQVLNVGVLMGAAAALFGFASAVKAICSGLNSLMETIQKNDPNTAMLALIVLFNGLYWTLAALGKILVTVGLAGEALNAKTLLGLSVALVAYGTAVKTLTKAVGTMADLDTEKALSGTFFVVTLMGALTAVAAAMKKWGAFNFQNGAGFAALSLGVLELAGACAILAGIDEEGIYRAAGAIMAFLAEFALIGAKSRIGLRAGAAFVAIASSVVILAGSMAVLALVPTGKLVNGFAMIEACLLSLFAVVGLLSDANAVNMTGAATAMLTISGAMIVLAGAVAVYAQLGDSAWSAMLKCGVAVAGMAVAVYGLSKLRGDALNAAAVISTLSGGMVKLAAACYVFNLVNWDSLRKGAAALGGMLAILFGAGWLATKLPVLASGLGLLGTAFDKLASGALKLAGATAVIGILSFFAGPICQAIINAAPDIGAALIAVVTMLCDVITQCAEPIVKAANAVIRAVVPVLWQDLKDALSFLGVPETWEELADATWNAIKTAFAPFKNNGLFQQRNIVFKANPDYQPQRISITDLFNTKDTNADAEKAGEEVGQHYTEGSLKGVTDSIDQVKGAGKEIADEIISSYDEATGTNSPSRVMQEKGKFLIMGLIEGLQDEPLLTQLKTSMLNIAAGLNNVFRNYWGIHSPSDLAADNTGYILEGMNETLTDSDKLAELETNAYNMASAVGKGAGEGLDEATKTVQTKMEGLYQAFKTGNPLNGNAAYQNGIKDVAKELEDAQKANVLIPGKSGITKPGDNGKALSAEQILQAAASKVQNLVQPITSYVDGYLDDFYQKVNDSVDEVTGGTTGKTKSGSSKSTKTAADNLVDEYTKKLKANKAKMDAASKEYDLWEVTEGDTATAEALVQKKGESLTETIAQQTERAALAKEQYDKVLAEKSSTDTQKSDAYATLLDEQKTLAELKGEKQATLFKLLKERYDDEAGTATDEYELWASLYEDTATVEAKSNRKIENLNRKLTVQAKVVTAAEDEYTQLKAEFGEESLRTQEAYRQWLEEQKEQQDLINEINQAQLDAFDDAVAMLEKQEKIITNRQNILQKIYNDGDLSQREEAYKAAVKQYGEDSKEARLASTQGTMSAILGVGTALDSMAYSVKKLTSKQDKYNEAVRQSGKDSENALDALADWQDEQYNFVGFAENLADAFDLDDSGKRMTMQLGYAIARNWQPIQNGFQTVWKKVETNFPQAAEKLANTFGLVVREGATEVITDVYSMITAAVGGDWGQALTSGIAAVLDFAGSDFGKTVMDTLGPVLATAGANLAAKLAPMAAALGPQGVIALAIVAGGVTVTALLAKNWDKVKAFFKNIWAWFDSLDEKFASIGKNLAQGLWNGITGTAKAIGDGLKQMGTDIVNGFRSLFGIHSPSTVTTELGTYMGQGFVNGIANTGSAIAQTMSDVARSALAAAQMSADMILSCFDEDADFRPTITPVVDLDGVRDSANWMQSAFASADGTLSPSLEKPTLLMRAYEKRREHQNGETTAAVTNSNDDVVAAIASLGDRVDAVSEAVRNMKLSIDGKKLVGGIIEETDVQLGKRAERRRR